MFSFLKTNLQTTSFLYSVSFVVSESLPSFCSFFSRRVNNEVRTYNYEVAKGVRTSCMTDTVTASSISKFRWTDVLGQYHGLYTLTETDLGTDSDLDWKPDSYIVLCRIRSHCRGSESDPYDLFLYGKGSRVRVGTWVHLRQ